MLFLDIKDMRKGKKFFKEEELVIYHKKFMIPINQQSSSLALNPLTQGLLEIKRLDCFRTHYKIVENKVVIELVKNKQTN
jgi:hypothetical protein